MGGAKTYKLKVILLWAFSIGVYSYSKAEQTIYVKFINATDTSSHIFYLFYYQTDRYYLKDSLAIKLNQELRFAVNETSVHMYKITSPGYIKDIELIVSSNEPEVRVSGTKEDLDNGNYNFFGSAENYCWQSMLIALKEFEES